MSWSPGAGPGVPARPQPSTTGAGSKVASKPPTSTSCARMGSPMRYKNTGVQGYLFANDIKVCTGICLGDIPIIQNEERKSYKSN